MNSDAGFVAVAMGELLWDVFPERKNLGGATANFACHAKALGLESHLVSAIGDDALGREAMAALKAKGVNVDFVGVVKGKPTGVVKVSLDSAGKPSYEIAPESAWDFPKFDAKIQTLARRADVFCFGSLAQRGARVRDCVQRFIDSMKPGSVKLFDINLRKGFIDRAVVLKSLESCNALKLNDEELPFVASLLGVEGDERTLLAKIVERLNLKAVALTKGADGCRISTRYDSVCEPCAKLEKIVDTVGAGDSFTAAFAAGLLKELSLRRVAVAANRIASYVCSQEGATPNLPPKLASF